MLMRTPYFSSKYYLSVSKPELSILVSLSRFKIGNKINTVRYSSSGPAGRVGIMSFCQLGHFGNWNWNSLFLSLSVKRLDFKNICKNEWYFSAHKLIIILNIRWQAFNKNVIWYKAYKIFARIFCDRFRIVSPFL